MVAEVVTAVVVAVVAAVEVVIARGRRTSVTRHGQLPKLSKPLEMPCH
jgi:hypothetical protein